MDGVLKGFFVVGVVLLVGYILGKTNALGPQGSKVLSSLTFMVGLPSLMFSTIASRHISDILSPTGLISVLTALAVMLVFAVSGTIFRWGVRRTTIGALATGIVNSTNLGVPLSLYILGNTTYVVPIMLFQLALVTPIALTILDLTNPTATKVSVWRILATPFRNPVTVAAILGVVVSALGLELPGWTLDPLKLVAQLAVPLMLIIFGMSLHGLSAGQGGGRPCTHRIGRHVEVSGPTGVGLGAGGVRFPIGFVQHIRGHGLRDPANGAERGAVRRPLRGGAEDRPVHRCADVLACGPPVAGCRVGYGVIRGRRRARAAAMASSATIS
ncbi:AEC family transporter [Paenarthrobacter sp. S56]|uniref:AEC family transporter n=1 Tax=Paenarthrobacter sp. S56 TaxID=3138179 RepID=UPI00321B5B4A